MNKQERADLVRDQYNAGLQNGTATGQIIIKQFPDGFSRDVARKIRVITDGARDHVLSALTNGGVEKKYWKPFAKGFNKGLSDTYLAYANECALRAK
ncbi:hypothetical protein SAMN05216337_102063 [Bradyrhizobium brasilense]|uniref:Uncharacterized protein n=1 Tax=Bradyrhizobium brasilense TaxID=1419277 RepID=A0A1G7ABM9_9BRAD|nr:hypothetical protein [Bradyrhizobium brasilense]SDE12314.1 hypothetical protein SAMN05216337_102063 [Bradyrhizobium brasilense]